MADDTTKNNQAKKANKAQPQGRQDYHTTNHNTAATSFDQDLSKWEADSMHNVKDEIMRHAFPSSF